MKNMDLQFPILVSVTLIASGWAVHKNIGVVLWPLVPGLRLLMGARFISFIQCLYPGWDAVWLSLFYRNAAMKKMWK
jgi:hypothetical protein